MSTHSQNTSGDVGVGKVFDIEGAIEDFRADSSRTSLELPHMTTGQRKHVKKVIDAYPELKCESFGLGQDRQLHVFRQTLSGAGQKSNQPNSCKPQMSANALQACLDDTEGKVALTCNGETSSRHRSSSLDESTSASDVDSSPRFSSKASSNGDQPFIRHDVQVRNTFIHMEYAAADERIVQSMPHGMFKQCLYEGSAFGTDCTSHSSETAMASAAYVPAEVSQLAPAMSSAALSLITQTFKSGSEIVIERLLHSPAMNGRHGIVQSFDEETGRYSVLLILPAPGGQQWAKVKPDNLRLTIPPPPSFAPSLLMEDDEEGNEQFSVPNTPTWYETNSGASALKLTALL